MQRLKQFACFFSQLQNDSIRRRRRHTHSLQVTAAAASLMMMTAAAASEDAQTDDDDDDGDVSEKCHSGCSLRHSSQTLRLGKQKLSP